LTELSFTGMISLRATLLSRIYVGKCGLCKLRIERLSFKINK